MKVLGLGTEGDSGASLVEDGRLVAALNEERTSRLKLVSGFPRESIRRVLELGGTKIDELDAVLVGGTSDVLEEELHPFEGWFQHWEKSKTLGGRIKKMASRFSRYGRHVPLVEPAYYAMLAPTFARRRRGIRRILRDELGVTAPIEFVDHHFCHVASAYFTSGFEDALVVSMDGGGDGKSSLIYAVRGGRFEYVHHNSAYNSLGNYYAYATHLCGFMAMKHEGKVTGLAAHGEPRFVQELREMVDERDGRILNLAGVVFQEAVEELKRRLPAGWSREDLAASIQRHFEDVVCRYVSHWARRTGLRDVALAGGVFANVRVNQKVHRLLEVGRVFVHPHMGDGGLSTGAALAACVPGTTPATMAPSREPLRDVYLGPALTESEIEHALGSQGLRPEPPLGPIEERIAELLARGYVVARAAGRMEYGPRALGNRSILYQPTDPSVNDWLNKNLRRTEFMPFAPSVLFEARDRCFEGVDGAEHPAEFMTITFDCTPWARAALGGVVHLDGTARPQLVRRDRNASYYAIIEAFQRRTGLPAIINTSFNMHEEPIVCSASDCVRAFLAGTLDYLAIGAHLVAHPRGVLHPLKPVVRAEPTLVHPRERRAAARR